MSAAQVAPQLLHQQAAAPVGPQQQEQQQPPAEPEAKQQAQGFEEEDDPKAALKKGLEETEEQILFSCNICYDVRALGRATIHLGAAGPPLCPNPLSLCSKPSRHSPNTAAARLGAGGDAVRAPLLLALPLPVAPGAEPLQDLPRVQSGGGEGQGEARRGAGGAVEQGGRQARGGCRGCPPTPPAYTTRLPPAASHQPCR